MTRERIFESWISVGTYEEFIDDILNLSVSKRSSYVCFANVHMVVEAFRDRSFRAIVNDADIVTPDGRPLSLFLRIFRGRKQDRVCGMDVLPDLLKRAAASDKSVYFYGTTNEVLESLVARAKARFPRLRICGYHSPPFRPLTDEEDQRITDEINAANPDFVLVALGCPKQEKWMADHKNRISSCMLGLGQAFHTFAGLERRLPRWMRNLGLEWVYRLYQEPRRLWKRYLYTNSYFLFLTVRHSIRVILGVDSAARSRRNPVA